MDNCDNRDNGVPIPSWDKEETGNGLISLFQNKVVVNEIADYLNFVDLKALSEVSVETNEIVRDTMSFKNKATLLISKDSYSLPFLARTTTPWRCLKIDVGIPSEELKMVVYPILNNATNLIFIPLSEFDKMATDLTKLLHFLVLNTPNLRGLQMDIALFKYLVFVDPFSEGVLPLSQLPLKLESLRLFQNTKVPRPGFLKFISNIIAVNRMDIQELQIQSSNWSSEGMDEVVCPNLRKLNIGYKSDLVTFLANHCEIEELEIHTRKNIPSQVISLIRDRYSKLKKLHLTARTISTARGPDDWMFLRGMSKLSDVSINRPKYGYMEPVLLGTGTALLDALPRKVIKIGFRGIDQFWFNIAHTERGCLRHFRRSYTSLPKAAVFMCFVIPGDAIRLTPLNNAERIALLAPFANIVELSLMRCRNVINDKLMQYILKELGRLKVFEVSHCDELSDFGLTGESTDECYFDSNTTLMDLKGLTRLKIRWCPNVTTSGLLKAVHLPFLRELDYIGHKRIGISFVVSIIKQNPCLDCIRVVGTDAQTALMREKINKVNSRIRIYNWGSNISWTDEYFDTEILEESDTDA